MSSLFDQSALSDLAERLVAAARRAGADQADAVAVRSISLSVDVRDGAVEELQRSEGDDVGLRVLVGQQQAAVSTNDVRPVTGLDALAERAVAMARAAPEDKFAGLADPALLARAFADLDLLDPDMPGVDVLEAPRAPSRGRRACRQGRQQVRRRLGHRRHRRHGAGDQPGFSGATIGSRHSVSMSAIAGNGTGMEQDYDFSSALHAADLEAADKIGRTAGERAVERLNPRKVTTRRVPVVFDARISGSLVGHLVSAANGAVDRAQDELPARQARATDFRRPASTSSTIRCGRRGQRSRAFDAEGVVTRELKMVEDGVLKTWLLDCATARELELQTTGHAQRGVSSVPYPGAKQSLPARPAIQKPGRADRRHRRRFLCHRPDRHGRQSRDRRL